jgi:parvulin-like peptidyl-prolyl isomerase
VGSISRPIPHENGWYVYQIVERRPAGLRPLDQVADRARRAAIGALRTERAKAAAAQARAAILSGASPEDAAKKFGARSVTATGVTRNGFIASVGRDPESVGGLMTLPEGEWSQVREGPAGVLLVQVTKHIRPPEEEFQQQEATLRQNLLSERQRVILSNWFQSVRKQAKIEDHRDEIFGA